MGDLATISISTLAEAGPSRKRTITVSIEQEEEKIEISRKVQKIHPFFMKQTEKPPEGSFRWLEPLGPNRTCLHGINLQPKATSKVAAFDLDGTIIKSDFGNKSSGPSGKPTFEWWRSFVPEKLKELHESGFTLLLISNQGIKPAALKTWKQKIPLIGETLKDVPFRILAASQKDQFRKPMPGMWYEIERIFKVEGSEIDKTASFFVGDAAGRQYTKAKADFSSTDRKWAENVGLTFLTPEEYFLKLPPHQNFNLPGFRASALPEVAHVTPTLTPILPNLRKQEVVLFVGYPCLGKSTFFRRHFQPSNYVHVNQDILKTRDKCVKAVKEALQAGQSCVVDNTNRDAPTRKLYVEICKASKIPIRCFLFTGSIELAWHNNLYRAYNLPATVTAKEPERTVLPYGAFTGFRDNYEEPQLSEGYLEIKNVNWVFEGTDEEKKHWLMWLQIDGK